MAKSSLGGSCSSERPVAEGLAKVSVSTKGGTVMKSKSLGVLITLMLVPAWAGSGRVQAQDISSLPPEVLQYADFVFYNGKILTADTDFSVVEAVAVRDKLIIARGDSDRITRMAGPNTRRIDLRGKTMTPGIIDMHGGPGGGSMIRYWAAKWMPNEPEWSTRELALEGIARSVGRAQPGEAVILPVYELPVEVDANAGGRAGVICDIFTLAEIDAISPDNPVFFLRNVNQVTMGMNSKAAEVTKRFLPPDLDTPFKQPNNLCVGIGPQVDGLLEPGQWAGNDYIYWIEPAGSMWPLFKEDVANYSRRGVTLGKQHMGIPLFNGIHRLWELGELNMRFRLAFPMTPHISNHTTEFPQGSWVKTEIRTPGGASGVWIPLDAEIIFRRWPNLSHMGDNMLRFAGIRIPSVGGNTPGGDAWMLEPKLTSYPDRWGNEAPFGGRLPEQEAMESGGDYKFRGRDVLINAARFGWDASCDHCVGDRSFREVLAAYEIGLKSQLVKRDWQRLTTNHTPMVNQADIAKAKELGIWSSISTGHGFGGRDGEDVEAALIQYGADRLNRVASPIKSFIMAGLKPSLEGTIWPDARREGKSAFFWVGKAITRTDEVHGRVWNADERLSRQQALWAATIWAAEQLAEDRDLGSIEVGKEADLLVLDADYMTVPEEEIGDINILLTMVEGRVVYEAEGGALLD